MALDAGAKAPDVPFRTLDGAATTLHEIVAPGAALLAFYKVSCPVCMLALPYLERLRAAGMNLLPVSQNSAAQARRFDADFLVRTALLDPEEDGFPASNAFAITHVPTMFLVEPDGRISWASTGFMKKELAELGRRAGIALFGPGDQVPEAKSG